jgi:hypothetical protein
LFLSNLEVVVHRRCWQGVFMPKVESSVAQALSRAHLALLNDLKKLEDSVDEAKGPDLTALRARLSATQVHILEHFRFEEENGYMDKVRKREPRLERAIDLLESEHRQLGQSLDSLIRKAKEATNLDHSLHTQVFDWIASVRKHETREDELVQDAFNLDIGTDD